MRRDIQGAVRQASSTLRFPGKLSNGLLDTLEIGKQRVIPTEARSASRRRSSAHAALQRHAAHDDACLAVLYHDLSP